MNKLFDSTDEIPFKQAFVVQFLASREAMQYSDNCSRGWKNHFMDIEDAVHLADVAWEQYREVFGE